ncbi:unnamed protein product, partial [Ilex paraguariensis]
MGEIKVISRGFSSGGKNSLVRKDYAWRARVEEEKICLVLAQKCVPQNSPITFTDEDLKGVHTPIGDPL